jgi:Fic family protein
LICERAAPNLWIVLGEAASKCEDLAGVPLRPSVAQALHQLYLAKGALATTAIEGNTLTEKEVLQRIEGKLKLPPSKAYLGQEIDNIVKACNRIGEAAQKTDNGLSPDLVCEFNRWVLEKLPPEENVIPGKIRPHSVLVGNVYRGAPPQDCEHLLARFCEWLESEDLEWKLFMRS